MLVHFSRAASCLLLVVLASFPLGCGEGAQAQGEVMLSITTDMAVPNDIDRVVWSVTLNGKSKPFETGIVELVAGTDFPVTLAIEAGPQTKAPVTIHVEGRKGSDPSLLRVSKDARVLVPNDRVASLELPLSWFCSEINVPDGCPDGTTCDAGHCVDAAVAAASLPEFAAKAPSACYDPTLCLTGAQLMPPGPVTLASDEVVPCGILGTTALGPDASVNVFVEVANERVGNYGFCGPFGKCFVPLHQSAGADGWHVLENGRTPAIELPSAVCEQSTTTVGHVAVARTSPSCPLDRGDRPLCSPAEASGCLTAPVCPASFPDSGWVGYACTDVNPFDEQADVLNCWSPPGEDATSSTPDDGRRCCLTGQAPADDPLLIDDMQGGPQIKRAPAEGSDAGWWIADIPNGTGDLEPAPEPALYTYRQFDPPVGPPGGPSFNAAACLSSKSFLGWFAFEGFGFSTKHRAYGMNPLDVSGYDGISFWGWSKSAYPEAPLTVQVSFPNVQTASEPGSECVTQEDGASRCDSFFDEVSLTGEWKPYSVHWRDLHQSEDDWGQIHFDHFKTNVYMTLFGLNGAGPKVNSQPFDFCVADIRFIEKDTQP